MIDLVHCGPRVGLSGGSCTTFPDSIPETNPNLALTNDLGTEGGSYETIWISCMTTLYIIKLLRFSIFV